MFIIYTYMFTLLCGIHLSGEFLRDNLIGIPLEMQYSESLRGPYRQGMS